MSAFFVMILEFLTPLLIVFNWVPKIISFFKRNKKKKDTNNDNTIDSTNPIVNNQ